MRTETWQTADGAATIKIDVDDRGHVRITREALALLLVAAGMEQVVPR